MPQNEDIRLVTATIALVLAFAALAAIGSSSAQATTCTTVPDYPGDAASGQELAAWMATGATAAGLPGELPVLGALVQSGLTNLDFGDADSVGFFQIRVGIWNRGPYAGFPDHPSLQLQWFVDQATEIDARRLAAGIDDSDPNRWGDWVAEVEREAEQFRGRYQPRLAEATALIVAGCPPPPAPVAAPPPGPVLGSAPPSPSPGSLTSGSTPALPAPANPGPRDRTPPALDLAPARHRRLSLGAATRVRLRCQDEACRTILGGSLRVAGRGCRLRLRSTTAVLRAGESRSVALDISRTMRRTVGRALRAGIAVRARLRITVYDAAGNATSRRRDVRIA